MSRNEVILDAMKTVAGRMSPDDVFSMTFFCAQCQNLVFWTPADGIECPFCMSELFTEDGEINGY